MIKSKNMKSPIASLFLLILLCTTNFVANAQERASWMKGKWGIMNHYLADWKSQTENIPMDEGQWNKMIDRFDVEGLAAQIASTGAGYYILTIGQNSGYYLSPNSVYDKLTGIRPSKCSHRDLIAEVAKALAKYKIRLIVYLPSGAPAKDKEACAALKWQNGPQPSPNKEFQLKWEQIIREWSLRWGKQIAGWWFDGCYWPNTMYRSDIAPNFASFSAAARAGNPEAVIAYNPGVVYRTISITPHEDYIAGEIDKPELIAVKRSVDGKVDGAQLHILSFLGEKWGMGSPRFTAEQIIGWSRSITGKGGAFTWDVPVGANGLMTPPFMEQLTQLGKALKEN
jgi:hypothetical protein